MTERSDLISLLTFFVSSSLFQRSESDVIDLAHIENDEVGLRSACLGLSAVSKSGLLVFY